MNLLNRSANSSNTVAWVVNFIFCTIFSVIVSIFYCTWCRDKYIGKIMLIFIHSSFCILNFLPACIPKFATVERTTQKVKQTTVSILLIYCTVVCKYCKGTQESV